MQPKQAGPAPADTVVISKGRPTLRNLLPYAAAFALSASLLAAAPGPVAHVTASTNPTIATTKLINGVEDMISGKQPTPIYLGGMHSDWKGNTDHCYSVYFRVALRQGLIDEPHAEALMASMHSGDQATFVRELLPQGHKDVPFTAGPTGIHVNYGTIPAGHLISMDGGDHVMMSTGKVLPDGEHEVYSFKGGGPETPVWGDTVGYDPAATVHKITLEAELKALQVDEQPLDHVHIVEGRSALELQTAL